MVPPLASRGDPHVSGWLIDCSLVPRVRGQCCNRLLVRRRGLVRGATAEAGDTNADQEPNHEDRRDRHNG